MPINIGPGGKFYATGGAKTLPINFVHDAGTLLDGFENSASWSAWEGTKTTNTTQVKSGSQSIKMQGVAGTFARLTKEVAWDLTSNTWNQLRYWSYLHNPVADYGTYQTQYLRLYSSNWDAGYEFNETPNSVGNSGWRLQTCPKSMAYAFGSPTWNITGVWTMVISATGKTPSISFDDLRYGIKAHPCVIFRFDDGYKSQYTEVFGYMRRYGMRGTLFVIGDWIDGGSGYVTHQQLQDMQSAGWTIGNHTRSSLNLTGEANQAAQEAQIANGKADLDEWGLTGGLYLAFPEGAWNADTITSMSNLGMRLGAADYDSSYFHEAWSAQYPPCVLPWNDAYTACGMIPSSNRTLAEMKGDVDRAISGGYIITPTFHDIGGGGSNWSVADFRQFVDYVYSKRAYITPITIDDYYRASLGSITVPELVG